MRVVGVIIHLLVAATLAKLTRSYMSSLTQLNILVDIVLMTRFAATVAVAKFEVTTPATQII